MKVIFVLTQSLDSPSGLGRFGPIAREMVKLGYAVEIVALHPAFDTLGKCAYVEAGVCVQYVAQMHVRKDGTNKQYYSTVALLVVALRAIWGLTKAIWQSDADVIHICKAQPFNVLASWLARRGRPVYCDCDDYEAEINHFGGRWQKKVVRFFEDNVRRFAKGLTVNTLFTANRYEQLGYPRERIVYIPNGIEQDRFTLTEPPIEFKKLLTEKHQIDLTLPIILYIGTLGLTSHPVDMLLAGFQKVLSIQPEAQLVLAGGGNDFELLQEMADSLGIQQKCFFIGRISPQLIPALLSYATVTVDPVRDDLVAHSRSPLKIIESIAMGIPVVTSDIGERRQQLDDGRCGILTELATHEALADALLQIITSTEYQILLRQHALNHREQFYWTRLVQQFVTIYAD